MKGTESKEGDLGRGFCLQRVFPLIVQSWYIGLGIPKPETIILFDSNPCTALCYLFKAIKSHIATPPFHRDGPETEGVWGLIFGTLGGG